MHRTAATASMLVRVCFSGAACLSAPLDPNDFTSLGVLPAGDLVIDTEGLTFGGIAGGVLHVQGGGAPDIAVYTFDGGSTLAPGDAITVTGGNALALLFRGSATLSGTIDVSGANGVDAVQNVETGIGGVGVAGGGRGGNGGPFSANQDGVGPGHGVVGSNSASVSGVGSGSGGGFGTMGGQGGVAVTFRPGGSAYGAPLRELLHAGSGGGGGGGQGVTRYGGGGGAGGGALEIGATSSLMFAGGALLANGGNGGEGFADGGGGSGGGVLLHAPVIQLDAATLIQANGGHGGISGLGGNTVNVGGCGGAGRVEIVYGLGGSISDLATIEVNAGPFQGDCTDGEPVVVEAVVPEPSGLVLLLLAAAARTSAMRRTQESRRNAYQ